VGAIRIAGMGHRVIAGSNPAGPIEFLRTK
jgi:hypothetical protein